MYFKYNIIYFIKMAIQNNYVKKDNMQKEENLFIQYCMSRNFEIANSWVTNGVEKQKNQWRLGFGIHKPLSVWTLRV